MAFTSFTIANAKICIDGKTGFICVTDINCAKDPEGGAKHVANWLRRTIRRVYTQPVR